MSETAASSPPGTSRLPLPKLGGEARVWLLSGALSIGAFALYILFLRQIGGLQSSLHAPWWVLAAGFYLTEICVVHLEFKREAHSFSLGEIPLVLALFFSTPGELLVAQVIGVGLALSVYRRQQPIKLAFNLANFCFEASLATLLFNFWAGLGSPNGPSGWTAAFFATLLASSLGAVLIALAISLAEGAFRLRALPKSLTLGAIVTAANTSLALLGVTILSRSPEATWLLLIPITILFLAYRSYTSMRQQHDSLEFLYDSTRVAHQSLETDAVLLTLLSSACEMFRAEMAEITLFPTEAGEPALLTTLGPEQHLEVMKPVELDPTIGVWARVAAEEEALLVARPIANTRVREHFAGRNLKDAMIAPLYGDHAVVGTMMVANRLSEVSTFSAEDLRLFETLSNHASVSLENARLVNRLKESLVHLTEMNRLKDDFVASVSHELRTPLTAISGYVKILVRKSEQITREQQRSFISSIDEQSDRLRHLIEDLLVVSRIESQQHMLQVDDLYIPELAATLVREVAPRSTHQRLEVDFETDFPLVTTDAEKIRQILSNLLENAIKYTPDGTLIAVRGWRDSDGVVVSVEDEGEGIPAELHAKIFDRFYQVDQSSTRKVGGTGLGLYICKKLAEVVGAGLELERSSSAGSVFTLRLPATAIPSEAASELGRSAQTAPTLIALEGGPRAAND
ncbi:MAG: GAF domain-containing protein [Actinobacteria bacterium]|nr:GAF domain-containing protein [Actinomycetota bacterium]